MSLTRQQCDGGTNPVLDFPAASGLEGPEAEAARYFFLLVRRVRTLPLLHASTP
jgi:hypothetical protein